MKTSDSWESARRQSERNLFSFEPTDEELAFHWTLSQADKLQIRECRGEDNQRIFAIQLCSLRKYCFFLSSYERIPLRIVNYINKQLALNPVLFLEYKVRDATKTEYERRICEYLEYKRYDEEIEEALKSWVFDQISSGTLPEDLANPVWDVLRLWKVVLPGKTIIERLITSVYSRFEKEIFERIVAGVPLATLDEIDNLLVPSDDSKSVLHLFKEYPPEATPQTILSYIERYWQLKFIGIDKISLTGISPRRIQNLSQLAKRYDSYKLRRFPPNKRHAMVACLLVEAMKDILDYIVEMHDQYLIKMNRRAKISFEKKHQALRKHHKRGVDTLIKLSKIVLSFSPPQQGSIQEIFQQITPGDIRYALDSCEQFKQLEEIGFVNELKARYSLLRQYIPDLFQLPFQGAIGNSSIIEAINIANKLNFGALKHFPENVPIHFVPYSWKKALHNDNGSINRQVWEIALAFAIRDTLRSRDIFLPESRRYVSFFRLIGEEETRSVATQQESLSLSIPASFDCVLAKLQTEFDEIAYDTARGLPNNPYASVPNGCLKLKRQDALGIPEGTKRLSYLLATHLPKIRIENLLMEVDSWMGFTKGFRPLEGYEPRSDESIYPSLLAALVAHGTNLGLLTMAASTDDITVDMLRNTKWFIRQSTIKAANNLLVNFHTLLPLSPLWGNTTMASSDGQRFGIRAKSLLGSVYPRYFGYYDRAITIYTHVSDQFSVFNTQAISCSEREAPYVLDGLVDNDTVLQIQQHHTDTHGFVEIIFALCYLLGISFMPRIKDLKKQRLYKMEKTKNYGEIDPLFAGRVDVALIREQWDPILRVATAILNRVTPAHVIVKSLVCSSRSDRLKKAFTALGRVLKTAYILRYINDEKLRRIVLLQLNRGESRHYLADHLFFAQQGEFRTKDYEEIMNKASCLSLLSNAALVWNTVKIGEIVERLRARGESIEDEFLSRVSPLMFAHIIPNGTYSFRHEK